MSFVSSLSKGFYLSCSHNRSSGSKLTIMRVGPYFRWSLKRGEARQKELVGMTVVAEAGAVDPSYLISRTTFEAEE